MQQAETKYFFKKHFWAMWSVVKALNGMLTREVHVNLRHG
jgi:hypothetical protein